jgi:hypothetical protein
MKAMSIILALLLLMAACASFEDGKSDTRINYGGSYRVRGSVSHGVYK